MSDDPWTPDRTISVSDLSAAILAATGQSAGGLVYFDRGFDNTVFRADGDWLFKVSHCDEADADIAVEGAALPLIAQRLPAPIPLPLRRGRPPESPWPFIGYKEVKGQSLVSWLARNDATVELGEQLGTFLRALHAPETLELVAPDLRRDHYRRTDLAYRGGMCLDRLTALELEQVDLPYARLREALAWACTFGDAEQPDGVAHGDLHQRHVLVDPDGNLAGVIDWGDMFRGAVSMDLELYWSAFEGAAAEGFLEAYGRREPAELALALVVAVYTCLALFASARDMKQSDIQTCAQQGLVRVGRHALFI